MKKLEFKTILILCLSGVIILMAVFGGLEYRELVEGEKLDRERKEVRFKQRLDSAKKQAGFRTDSIVAAVKVKSRAEVLRKEQALKTEIKRRKRAEVKYVALKTDLARDSVLQTLYVSKPDSLTYATPVNYLDSMAYETKLGRSCAELSASQDSLIADQSAELVAGGKLIGLQSAQIQNLEFQSDLQDQRLTNVVELNAIDKEKLRAKNKKKVKIIIGQAVVILGLVLLL